MLSDFHRELCIKENQGVQLEIMVVVGLILLFLISVYFS